jgi:hypothetical protein
MRFMCTITIPSMTGNAAIMSGKLFPQIKKAVENLKPEALYFGIAKGQRTMYMVVDIPSADKLPWTFEAFWLDWGTDIKLSPIMTLADMEKAGKDFEKILKERM